MREFANEFLVQKLEVFAKERTLLHEFSFNLKASKKIQKMFWKSIILLFTIFLFFFRFFPFIFLNPIFSF